MVWTPMNIIIFAKMKGMVKKVRITFLLPQEVLISSIKPNSSTYLFNTGLPQKLQQFNSWTSLCYFPGLFKAFYRTWNLTSLLFLHKHTFLYL